MIKILVSIAYDQIRPTGVASALIAQFGFWAKSALKMHCTKIFGKCTVDNSSSSFFRCSPLKITDITLAFGVIVNKNVCKTFVGTKIHENMYKICRRGAERRFGAPHRA